MAAINGSLVLSCVMTVIICNTLLKINLFSNQILQVEDESVLLDFLNLLEETRVQSTFFNIKADSVDLLGYVEFKPMLFYQVDAEHKVLNIGSHDTNDQNDLKGKFLYSHVGLLGVIQDLVKEGTCLVNGLIRYEKGLIDPVQ